MSGYCPALPMASNISPRLSNKSENKEVTLITTKTLNSHTLAATWLLTSCLRQSFLFLYLCPCWNPHHIADSRILLLQIYPLSPLLHLRLLIYGRKPIITDLFEHLHLLQKLSKSLMLLYHTIFCHFVCKFHRKQSYSYFPTPQLTFSLHIEDFVLTHPYVSFHKNPNLFIYLSHFLFAEIQYPTSRI